jgi:hypothetical protein
MTASSRRNFRIARLGLLAIAAFVGLPAVSHAQSLEASPTAVASGGAAAGGDASSGHAVPALARAVRASGRVSVDGRLDEAAWRSVAPITTFTQVDPVEGAPVSQPTEVRILFDDEAVYLGATLHDDHPVSLRVARRDAGFNDSDVFAVALDSYHDHQTAFRFVVNASGSKRDEVISSTGSNDLTWDPVWQSAVRVSDSGWVAELRIPYSQLRFGRTDVQTWGIQLERRIARTQEYAVYAFTPKKLRGGPARFHHLTGMSGVSGGRRLEVLPYTYGRAAYRVIPTNPSVAFANPYRSGADYVSGLGADLKYRLTSNFTVDATVNPDFGQVEVDPALINLSAFETRYEEKRPFFVEGAEIFRFGSSLARDAQLLYSRRVGRAPQVGVPSEAAYADVPETATILGAAKLTGKTAGGWSAGLLEAVTGRATARFVDTTEAPHHAAVEPATSYFAGRVRKSTASGGTSFGALVTAVQRGVRDSVFAARLRSSAYVGGMDFRHEWGNRDYSFSAQLASSVVSGAPSAITSTQRSSARYFQRPDAGYLGVDSGATRLAGYNAFVALGKFAGDWQRNVTLSATSPRFEINDLGFQSSADRLGADVEWSYHRNEPSRTWRRWEAAVSPDVTWNYGGDRVGGGVNARAGGTLASYWNVNLNYGFRGGSLDDRLTRGGPLAARPAEHSLGGWIGSDGRKAAAFSVSGNHSWNAAGGLWQRVGAGVALKPASNVEIQTGPELTRGRNVSQYVTALDDATAAATFGRRYLFATLDQTTLSMDTRVNVAFSPALTLEVYAQPFVSAGDYGDLKQLHAPRTRAFDVFGRDVGTSARDSTGVYQIDPDDAGPAPSFGVGDRDFSFRSLRGNAVLRWEWRPGSTLYLVWQQSRAFSAAAADGRVGRFDPYRDARELFGIRPDNVVQVKFTWWLNP